MGCWAGRHRKPVLQIVVNHFMIKIPARVSVFRACTQKQRQRRIGMRNTSRRRNDVVRERGSLRVEWSNVKHGGLINYKRNGRRFVPDLMQTKKHRHHQRHQTCAKSGHGIRIRVALRTQNDTVYSVFGRIAEWWRTMMAVFFARIRMTKRT